MKLSTAIRLQGVGGVLLCLAALLVAAGFMSMLEFGRWNVVLTTGAAMATGFAALGGALLWWGSRAEARARARDHPQWSS